MTNKTKIRDQSKHVLIKNILPKIGINEIRNEILAGLLSEKKEISSKYFYDSTGSELFEKITELPEYYPSRTEKHILQSLNLSFLNDLDNLTIVELGSGDHSKINILVNKIPLKFRKNLTYTPVDISASAVKQSGTSLYKLYPEIKIEGYIADFFKQLNYLPDAANRLFCFFGSTVGNLMPEQTNRFFKSVSDNLKPGEYFLIGFDNIKDVEILEKAYNDKSGVTEAFNLNILKVVNQLAGTDFFVSDFKHIAFYNTEHNRIEMHLEARYDIDINCRYLKKPIKMKKGERIHTENSCKFGSEDIKYIADTAGFELNTVFTDEKRWFSLVLFQKK